MRQFNARFNWPSFCSSESKKREIQFPVVCLQALNHVYMTRTILLVVIKPSFRLASLPQNVAADSRALTGESCLDHVVSGYQQIRTDEPSRAKGHTTGA